MKSKYIPEMADIHLDMIDPHPLNKRLWNKTKKEYDLVQGIISVTSRSNPVVLHREITGRYTTISGDSRVEALRNLMPKSGQNTVKATVLSGLSPLDQLLNILAENVGQLADKKKLVRAALVIQSRHPHSLPQIFEYSGLTQADINEWKSLLEQAAEVVERAKDSGNSARAIDRLSEAAESPESLQKSIDKSKETSSGIGTKAASVGDLAEKANKSSRPKCEKPIKNSIKHEVDLTSACDHASTTEATEAPGTSDQENISKIVPEATPPQPAADVLIQRSAFSATKATATLASFAREISTSFNGDEDAAWAVNHLTALFNKQPLPMSRAEELEESLKASQMSLFAEREFSGSVSKTLSSLTEAVMAITSKSPLVKAADINAAFSHFGLLDTDAEDATDADDDDALPF